MDTTATTRNGQTLDTIIYVLAVLFALFHLYTAMFGAFQTIIQRSVHVGGGVILFLLLAVSKRDGENKLLSGIDLLLAVVTAGIVAYLVANFDNIMHPMFEPRHLEVAMGVVMVGIVFYVTQRLIGWAIPLLSLFAVAYALFGPYFPGIWKHSGVSLNYIMEVLFLSDRGLWGLVTGISATIIAMFMIFGAVLFTTGGGKAFMDLATCITGNSYGGAGKLAAVASGLFGMISGSAAANVATTGAFTIPLMKRLGYAPEFAGGVESSASSGGQIMPPIMGAAAFIMAEILAMSYSKLALAAIIPSVLFYFGVILAIHFESKKMNYRGIPREEIPPFREVIHYKNSLAVFVPIGVLLVFFFMGYTPVSCAMRALGAAVILYLGVAPNEWKHRVKVLIDGLAEASKDMLSVIALIACAQVLLAMIGLTGVGVKFTNLIIAVGGSNIFLAGVCAMLGTMLLGMGLPTVAAYLVAAAVMAPALIKLGVEPIAAHFFIFYYSIFAGITPPVCGTVFIGATIAGANWVKTAWVAMRLSLGAYIVPFMFLVSPALLLVGTTGEIVHCAITATLGVFAMSAGGMGYLLTRASILERLILFIGGLLMVEPNILTDTIGGALFALAIGIQVYKWSRKKKAARAAADTAPA
ncbi:MAG: TRAP transporter fused permease subunit [Deltaproteobacteria bacterium]|nr:TRAP transporter fused permease subunit [Deltaproteobacteria bacterium]